MSEPAKKPNQQPAPESYSPKAKPEIMRALGEQARSEETVANGTIPKTKGGTPMKPTDYDFQFSVFRDLDFTNCFTGLYCYLEGIQGVEDYDCAKKQGQPCRHPNCHHRCSLSLQDLAGRLFFLFDTVSGRAAAARGWGNRPTAIYREIYDTDGMIDFLMGYAGLVYEKYKDNLMEHIRKSIDAGCPVLARLKKDGAPYLDGKADSFRLITGCDGGKLLMPEAKGAQNKPKKAPRINDIDSVYAVTGRGKRKYTLLDGLKRIKRVMDCDRENGVWDEYIQAFSDSWEKLDALDVKAIKQLFRTAHDGTTWNCHNFAAPFRTHEYLEPTPEQYQNWIWDEWKNPRLSAIPAHTLGAVDDPLRLPPKTLIDWASDQSHNKQWQLHALYETRDWSKKYYRQMEWAGCETAVLLLQKIKEYDGYIYQAVCAMIAILEEDAQ